MKYAQPFDQIDPNASYVDGNPATGTQGSIVPARAIEQAQREIVAAIVGAGFTPTDADLTQLWQALLVGGYCVAGGTANALTAILLTSIASYLTGMRLKVLIASNNTGPATINVNGLGAKSIVDRTGAALSAGALVANGFADLTYDGTHFQLGGGAGGGANTFYGTDAGTANAVVTTIANAPTSLTAGAEFFIKKIASANTAGMTVQINSLGPYTIINADGTAISSGEVPASYLMNLVFDGTSMRLMNGTSSTSVGALTASSGEGVNVNGSAVVSLNIPGLSSPVAPVGNTDLFPFQSIADGHARVLTLAQLMGAFASSVLRISTFTTPGTATWTKGVNTRKVLVIVAGAGGAGGGDSNTLDGYSGAGGAAGGTAIALVDVTAVSTVNVTVGAGGAGVPGADGNAGAASSFGTFAAATGGQGGWGTITLAASTALAAPAAGTGTVGDVKLKGQDGGPPPGGSGTVYSKSTTALGGMGGSSFLGGGSGGYRNAASGPVQAANGGQYGGGGGGGDRRDSGASGTGGNGGDGGVIVLELF